MLSPRLKTLCLLQILRFITSPVEGGRGSPTSFADAAEVAAALRPGVRTPAPGVPVRRSGAGGPDLLWPVGPRDANPGCGLFRRPAADLHGVSAGVDGSGEKSAVAGGRSTCGTPWTLGRTTSRTSEIQGHDRCVRVVRRRYPRGEVRTVVARPGTAAAGAWGRRTAHDSTRRWLRLVGELPTDGSSPRAGFRRSCHVGRGQSSRGRGRGADATGGGEKSKASRGCLPGAPGTVRDQGGGQPGRSQ